MLVNLTPNKQEIDRILKISKELKIDYIPQFDKQWIIEEGIYQCSVPFNFPIEEFEEYKQNKVLDFTDSIFPNYEKITYGVADNIEQIKEYYKEEIEDKNNYYVIAVTPVYQDKKNKGKGGGWRWHKWGEYIGKLNPQYEYLDDEDFGNDFEYILTFEIMKIRNK